MADAQFVPYLDLYDRVKAMNTIAAIRRRRRRVAENNRKLAAGANNASSRQSQKSVNNDSASSPTSPTAPQDDVHGNRHGTEDIVWPRYLNRLREAFSLDFLSSVEEQNVATSRTPATPPTRPSSSERVRLTKVVDSLPPRTVAHFLLNVCIKHGTDVFFYFDQAQIINELDQFYADPSCSLRLESLKHVVESGGLYILWKVQIAYARLVAIMDTVADLEPTTTDDARLDMVLCIEARLKEWKDSLPEGFHLDAISPRDSRHRAVFNLYLNYYYTRIIMGKASLVEIVRKTLRYHLGQDTQPWDIGDTTEKLARSCKRASRKLLRLFAGLDQISDTTRLPFTYFQGCSIATIVTLVAGILGRDFGYQQRVTMGLSCLRRMASGIQTAEMGVKLVESLQSISDEASRKLSLSRQPSVPSHAGQPLISSAYNEWTTWLASQGEAVLQPWIQRAEEVVDPVITRQSIQQQVHSELHEASHSITGCDDGQLFLMNLTGLSGLDLVGVAPDVEQ
ncbi:hypothetical protein FHETE_10300 [Fusarium heterosporum]|uniref:Uncharacterized protein n=1 Tax=Fusarium heterosporum TaxID=42747 RepID=A0A8H5WGK0_FUSHE|nr:hypothetical protein FHETE_10300 [Fusarium heterosporum]